MCLTKETKGQSLGMTIIGGDGTEGIYVDRMVTGGLANLDGRIKKGTILECRERLIFKETSGVELLTFHHRL